MANQIVTIGTLPPPIQQQLDDMILATPQPNPIYRLAAMKSRHARNGGDIHRFIRFNQIDPDLVPLSEDGLESPASNLTDQMVDAKIQWYSQWLMINERVVLQSQEDVLQAAAYRLGVAMRQTEDELIRNCLNSSASSVDAQFGDNGDTPTNITVQDITAVTTALRTANGIPFLSGIPGKDVFGSSPIRSAYIAMSHTNLCADYDDLSKFVPNSEYPSQQYVIEGEYGSVRNARFFVSSIGTVLPAQSALGNDIYVVSFTAKQGYGLIEQDGATAELVYRPAVFSGAQALNVTLSYKFAAAFRVLQEAWVTNLNCTLSSI